jgi:hypothetical protein
MANAFRDDPWDNAAPIATKPSSSDWFASSNASSSSGSDTIASSLSKLSLNASNSQSSGLIYQKRADRFSTPKPGDYVHVSRQLGLEDSVAPDLDLRRHEVQERFYREIHRDLDTAKTATDSQAAEIRAQAVVSFRKLREGVVSSGRHDGFAIKVYEDSVAAARVAGNWEEMKRSLQPLVYEVYSETDAENRTEWPRHARLLLLYFICFAVPQPQAADGTNRTKEPLHGSTIEIWTVLRNLPKDIRASEDVRWALALLSALRSVDYIRFSSLIRSARDEDESMIGFILERYRVRVLAVLHRAFYTFPADLLAKYLCFENQEEATDFVKSRYPTSSAQGFVITLRSLPGPKK